jgi:hypothetical protein
MTLESLLVRAGLAAWERHLWFSSSTLANASTLYVSDIDDHNTIERCWMPRLREVLPHLTLVFSPPRAPAVPPQPSPLKSKPAPYLKGQRR